MAIIQDVVEKEMFNEIMNSAKYVLDLVEKGEIKESYFTSKVEKAYKNNLIWAWTREEDIEFSPDGDASNVIQMRTPDNCHTDLLFAWGRFSLLAENEGYDKDYTKDIVTRCLIRWKREEIIEKRTRARIQDEYIQFLDEGYRGQFSTKAFAEKYGYPYQTTSANILKDESFVARLNEERKPKNILPENITRSDFREWLENNYSTEKECWTIIETGRPRDNNRLYKIDAIEEAICFGWMCAENKILENGIKYQRWCPRNKDAFWSELDKARAKRLQKLGLMTDAGKEVLPDLSSDTFAIPEMIMREMEQKKVLDAFTSLPDLYQRVRIDKILEKDRDREQLWKRIEKLIKNLEKGLTVKQSDTWNDYGRLIEPIKDEKVM